MIRFIRKTRAFSGPVPLFALADFLVLCAAVYLAVLLRFSFNLEAASHGLGPVFPRAVAFALWIMLGLASMGMYRHRQRPRPWEILARVIVGVAIGVFFDVLFFYFVPVLATGRGVIGLASLLSMFGLGLERWWLLRAMDSNPVKRRILVLGAGRIANRIGMLRRRSDRRRFDIVGFVVANDQERQLAAELGLRPLCELPFALKKLEFDEIVVALDDRRGMFPMRELLEQKYRGIRVMDIVEFLERETERIELDVMQPGWLIFGQSGHAHPVFLAVKRLFDLCLSASLLIVMSPVLLCVIVAIKLEDGISAPVFYRQKRVGKDDRTFELLKFRSMGVDAESGTGPRWSVHDDERVTRVGNILRRFRLDEVPQLVNVLRGEMSIVGPRPERPEFVESLASQVSYYDYRHCMRPGLTGWAQLNFPYGACVEDAKQKLKYDLYYIKNASLVFDIFVFLQTVEVVIWGKAISMSGPVRLEPEQPEADDRTAASPVKLLRERGRDVA